MAAKYDLQIDQGSFFRRVFTWTDDEDTPVDLTGYTAKAELRELINEDTAAITLTDADGITLGGADGTIDFRLTASQTSALDAAPYVWDIFLTPPSGADDAVRLLAGEARVTGRVTQ